MKVRKKARELAFKILFALDVGKNSLPDVVNSLSPESPVVMSLALELVKGVNSHIKELDEKIVPLLENWEFGRISATDRNVLRLAIYEINYVKENDPGVAVFEAVEIAKKYGSDKSKEFVNGILRSYLRRMENEEEKA
jgi:N utilization substance protein B